MVASLMLRAIRSGNSGEKSVAKILDSMNIEYEQQYKIGLTMWKKTRVDFFLPKRHSILEVKKQIVSGSADEKLAYLVMNIKKHYPFGTVIVLVGTGHSKQIKKWLLDEIDYCTLVDVVTIHQLRRKLNSNEWDEKRF